MSLLWLHDTGARSSSAQLQAGRGFKTVSGGTALTYVANAGRGGNTPVLEVADGNTNYVQGEFSADGVSEIYFFARLHVDSSTPAAHTAAILTINGPGGTVLAQLKGNGTHGLYYSLYMEGTLKQADAVVLSAVNQRVIEIHVKAAMPGMMQGELEMKVDGVSVCSETGLEYSEALISNFFLRGATGSGNTHLRWQDLIVCDTGANVPNTWLGPYVFVETQFPTGDGNSDQFTLSTGSDHYAVVDETPANDETDYAYSETEGQIEQYTFPDLPSKVGTLISAALAMTGRPHGSGGGFSVQPSVRVSTTDYAPVAAKTGAGQWTDLQFVVDENPATEAAWTISELNGAQLGIKHPAT